jgi:hypothetical protein
MSRSQRALWTISIGAAAALAAPAAATLISVDDPRFGPGSVTLDTVTGFRWLDLTASSGRSWLDVEAELGSGGDYAGARHATIAEVFDLLENGGLPLGEVDVTNDPELLEKILSVQELLGITSPVQRASYGQTAEVDPNFDDNLIVLGIEWLRYSFPDGHEEDRYEIGYILRFFNGLPPAYEEPEVGHFLILPEPGTFVLLAWGLATLGRWRSTARRSGTERLAIDAGRD